MMFIVIFLCWHLSLPSLDSHRHCSLPSLYSFRRLSLSSHDVIVIFHYRHSIVIVIVLYRRRSIVFRYLLSFVTAISSIPLSTANTCLLMDLFIPLSNLCLNPESPDRRQNNQKTIKELPDSQRDRRMNWTDRQTDRQTDWEQTDSKTDRQTDRQTCRH